MEAIFEDCVHLTVNHSDNFVNSKLMNIEEFVEKTERNSETFQWRLKKYNFSNFFRHAP